MPGNKTTHAARVAGKNGFSLISDEKFREMYAALLKCSLLDARLHAMAGYEPWTGHLAGTAGVAACLHAGDSITLTPRGTLAGYLLNGRLDLAADNAAPGPASHLASATGDALRHKLEKRGNVAVVFTGIAEPDTMREIFSAASKQALPALYVLEGGTPTADVCRDIPVMRVDAADTVAVYRVAYESIFRARSGGGPTIIECTAWPGEDTACPLKKLEDYLAAKKLFRRDWKQRLEKKYSDAADGAASRFLRV